MENNFRTNTSLPYVIALVNNTDYPLTAFCSIAGKVNNEIFNIGLKHLDEAIKSKYTGKFLRLTEKQMIELVNDYIEDNCMVAKMKSDLVESKIIIEHPNNIFNKNDVKILNKKLKLNEKLEIGEWDFLIIQKDDSYLISLNKSSTDVFTLFLVKKDYKELALAVKDISERISKIFYGKIPKGKTKLMNFV